MARLDDQRLTIHIRVRFHVDLSWNSLLKLRLFGGPSAVAEIREILRRALAEPAASEQHVEAVVRAYSGGVVMAPVLEDDDLEQAAR